MSDRKVLEVRLVALDDSDSIPQRRVLLAAGQDVIVGRASSNRGVAASADNTKISNPVISKEHAAFTLDPAGTTVLIKDLRSMHGTRVDDRELPQGEERAICSGSTLQFGSSVIRGNATYKPARFIFRVEPVNPTNASPIAMPVSATMPQSMAFSDTKKGYGDDSSLYSEDYDSEDDYMSDHEAVDVTLIPDTYSSEHDSEASQDDSFQTSSDDSLDELEGYDGMSMDNCCSTDSACLSTEAAAETGSSSAAKDQSSFCSSYLGESSVLPPGTDIDTGMSGGEWPDYSEADQSTFFSSTSAAWTSEPTDHFNFNMETDEHTSSKRLKARPFSNSINDLCEPAPKTEANPSEVTANDAPQEAAVVGSLLEDPPCNISPASVDDQNMADIQPLVDDTVISAEPAEGSKVEPTCVKRSAGEAELDAEPTDEPSTGVKANQIATPEQMSSRRLATFTRRARDIGIGAVVGGVAMFTLLVGSGDPA
ncbi:hypothetical protein DIS24_g3057 [Lasiodiplodia hormozganensis]|uniref:FHA domain-containing protein n=1 Tax=Lasiodiplodia hormozganensis TaxID=869390 RepID=A0AA40D2S0_9PEZI|nr:hypothetical protein DIS24_g3057 [Lasiodiplodia hormozganensis]